MANHLHITMGLLVLALGCEQKLVLHKGDELYTIAEDAVLEVRLRSETRLAEARRFTPEGPFFYSFEQADGSFERCPASPVLDAALRPVRSIRVSGVLDEPEEQELKNTPASAWLELDIRDIIVDGEPFHLRLLRHPRNPKQLFARVPGHEATLLLDSSLVSLLDQSCRPR